MKSTLEDISAELEGLSALVSVLSVPFLEDDGKPTAGTTGKALFALSCYAERLSDDILAISEIERMETAAKT